MVPPEPPAPIIPSIVSTEPELPIDAQLGCMVTLSSEIPPEDESKYRWLADISPYGVVQSEYTNGWWYWEIDDFYMEGTLESCRNEIRFGATISGHLFESLQLIAIDAV